MKGEPKGVTRFLRSFGKRVTPFGSHFIAAAAA